jgi:hypothetical protein
MFYRVKVLLLASPILIPLPALAGSIENLTKEECWNTPGALSFSEYLGQGRTPAPQRLGTCYTE